MLRSIGDKPLLCIGFEKPITQRILVHGVRFCFLDFGFGQSSIPDLDGSDFAFKHCGLREILIREANPHDWIFVSLPGLQFRGFIEFAVDIKLHKVFFRLPNERHVVPLIIVQLPTGCYVTDPTDIKNQFSITNKQAGPAGHPISAVFCLAKNRTALLCFNSGKNG